MASTWDMYDTFEQRDQEIRGLYTDLFQTPYKNLRKMIRNNGVYKIIFIPPQLKRKKRRKKEPSVAPAVRRKGRMVKPGPNPRSESRVDWSEKVALILCG